MLRALTQPRLMELARELGVVLPASGRKDAQIAKLLEGTRLPLPAWLGYLVRDELRSACRDHGLDAASRSRAELAGALLDAAGLPRGRDTIPPMFESAAARDVPRRGDIVAVRHRQYLVEAVHRGASDQDATRVELVGLDDDNQGRRAEVLWELELGAHVVEQGATLLGDVARLDPPRTFGAYYNAVRWNRVTATDARLFQAPFRAGVKVMSHQLTPLKRALDLPRANLFIADDVGLGKTIEAGLVLQELLLRHQVEVVVIVAPASVCPQWQREMATRFGLSFELYNRAFVQRRRQDRGFGVNPWLTHTRFVISYQTLRRPEYEAPLMAMLAEGDRKTLLILDEAHTAAPSAGARYAVPSDTTRVIGQLAPHFDHRLFLSATPHNGHRNSFSTLLSLLDRQRFTRGVNVDPRALEQIMVRRLKSDLRALGRADGFPEREVLALSLTTKDAPELAIARLLAEYRTLAAPGSGRDQLVFVNLQKRLLSSVFAFARTLEAHARALGVSDTPDLDRHAIPGATGDASALDDDEDVDDEVRDVAEIASDAARTRHLAVVADGRTLVVRMLQLARRHREAHDAKFGALLAWIRANQCPAAGVADAGKKALTWSARRVIVFTEYGDTKTYLVDQLTRALAHTDDGDARVMTFHGGMSDVQRDLVQRAFNGDPDEHAVRILIATDAAREGLNLQARCADLFHYDIPWNPARMEQRNGRIDRALQPAPLVRCHYFVYEHRPEDRVLRTLVAKVATIQQDLGSLSTVVLEDVERVLARGIDDRTLTALEGVGADEVRIAVVNDELETQRDRGKIKRSLEDNDRILRASELQMGFDPELLRETLDVALELAGAPAMVPAPDAGEGAWTLPDLPPAWQGTLDTIRPPRERDEAPWDWRARPPLPVVFTPPDVMTEAVAHLHLSHPVTQRLLSRFVAQGFSARDLSRVTAMHAGVAKPAVLALGRLSLFGPGAARLHDELIAVGAWWDEDKRGSKLRPVDDKASGALRAALEACLHERAPKPLAASIARTLVEGAAEDFAALWGPIEEEAEAEKDRAVKMLSARGKAEAEAMRTLITNLERSIDAELDDRKQGRLLLDDPREKAAHEAESRAMTERKAELAAERDREPARIEAQYRVSLARVTPVGLVYLWPAKDGRKR